MRFLSQLLLFTSLVSTSAFALTETGFIKKGKKYVVFREGEKVGKTFAELFPKHEQKRATASIKEGETILHYQKDDNRICYYINNLSGLAISCVK